MTTCFIISKYTTLLYYEKRLLLGICPTQVFFLARLVVYLVVSLRKPQFTSRYGLPYHMHVFQTKTIVSCTSRML